MALALSKLPSKCPLKGRKATPKSKFDNPSKCLVYSTPHGHLLYLCSFISLQRSTLWVSASPQVGADRHSRAAGHRLPNARAGLVALGQPSDFIGLRMCSNGFSGGHSHVNVPSLNGQHAVVLRFHYSFRIPLFQQSWKWKGGTQYLSLFSQGH